MSGKTVAQSKIVMARTMQPTDANGYGNVHGGVIMRFVDEAAGSAAIRHTSGRCVTASIDYMSFEQPVYIGDLVTIEAFLTYVGKTSIEVQCTVTAENLITGEPRHISTCYMVFVHIDEHGKPISAPDLVLETEADKANYENALKRRELRAQLRQHR